MVTYRITVIDSKKLIFLAQKLAVFSDKTVLLLHNYSVFIAKKLTKNAQKINKKVRKSLVLQGFFNYYFCFFVQFL